MVVLSLHTLADHAAQQGTLFWEQFAAVLVAEPPKSSLWYDRHHAFGLCGAGHCLPNSMLS